MCRKGRSQIFRCADDMIFSIKYPKDSTIKLTQLINTSRNVAANKYTKNNWVNLIYPLSIHWGQLKGKIHTCIYKSKSWYSLWKFCTILGVFHRILYRSAFKNLDILLCCFITICEIILQYILYTSGTEPNLGLLPEILKCVKIYVI